MTPTVFHRRKRLRRRGGNQWYLDRTHRIPETVCGAPVTEFDIPYRDRGKDWTRRSDGRQFVVCFNCRNGKL